MDQTKISKYANWLLHPWTILASVSAGTVIGVYFKETAAVISPVGKFYLSFLQMCVIPIMSTAIIVSIYNLLRSQGAARYLSRIIAAFLCGLFLASGIGVVLGLGGEPGRRLDQATRIALGRILTESESDPESAFAPEMVIGLDESLAQKCQRPGLLEDLHELVPSNIFKALSEGQNIKILFFSVILGIAIAFVPKASADYFIFYCDAVFKAFERIIMSAMYLLPFGLCCLLADQIAAVGLEVLYVLIRFVALLYGGAVLLILINGLVIWMKTGVSFFRSFQQLKESLIIALGTRSSFAAMPAALEELHQGFKVPVETANFVIPLGITLCRYGTVMAFSLATVFFAQLYETPMGVHNIVIIWIGAILAGISAAGSPGVVALSMLAIVFDPLGLPLGPAIVLLLAIDPVTDPILTLVNVHTNCAMATLIADPADPEKSVAAIENGQAIA